MSDSVHLGLPYLDAAQAQKHITHNEALARLDALVHLSVQQRNVGDAPASPVEGARLLVGDEPSGAFAGKSGWIAAFDGGIWRFYQPRTGWRVFVEGETVFLVFDGTDWIDSSDAIRSLHDLERLGIGATADANNPFIASLNSALFTARYQSEGGSGNLRLYANKESQADTASHVFQSGYSGRAEFGLIGDDSFHIKLSPDGSAWSDVLVADPATGIVSFPFGISAPGIGLQLNRIERFITSGVFAKQPSDVLYFVQTVGGGGGGGAGSRSVNGQAGGGGAGGNAGLTIEHWLPASVVGATLSVTIGAGGAGAAPPADSSVGGNGSNGGSSYFGNHIFANGGIGGKGSSLTLAGRGDE